MRFGLFAIVRCASATGVFERFLGEKPSVASMEFCSSLADPGAKGVCSTSVSGDRVCRMERSTGWLSSSALNTDACCENARIEKVYKIFSVSKSALSPSMHRASSGDSPASKDCYGLASILSTQRWEAYLAKTRTVGPVACTVDALSKLFHTKEAASQGLRAIFSILAVTVSNGADLVSFADDADFSAFRAGLLAAAELRPGQTAKLPLANYDHCEDLVKDGVDLGRVPFVDLVECTRVLRMSLRPEYANNRAMVLPLVQQLASSLVRSDEAGLDTWMDEYEAQMLAFLAFVVSGGTVSGGCWSVVDFFPLPMRIVHAHNLQLHRHV